MHFKVNHVAGRRATDVLVLDLQRTFDLRLHDGLALDAQTRIEFFG